MAKVHAYGSDLYTRLEEETGLHSGWHGCGAVRLARNDNEVDWFRYVKGVLDLVRVESHLVGPSEIVELHPLLDVSDIKMGLHTVNDGWTDPTAATNAMAAGARQLGAEVSRHNRVTDMNQLPSGRWELITEKGRIVADHVVNAAGHYAPQLGAMVGLDVPIVSMIHQYLVTEPIAEVTELTAELPVVRDPRASCYYRQEHDGLIIGPYETQGSKPYGVDGIDWDLTFHLTPPEVERLLPWLGLAAERIPSLGDAGIKQVVSGPITHTPDAGYLMGPAPGVRNYWMCCGASIGVTQGPGAGKYLAQWMVHGQTEINVREMDPRRFGAYAPGDYTLERSIDEYHEMYQVRMPGEYRDAGRPVRQTPLYPILDAKGAQWQEVYGWERVQFFSSAGAEIYSFRRSSAFDDVGREVRAVRNGVGVADLSAFSKFEVTGRDATAFLDRLSANRLPSTDGGLRLVHMLTELGGIESEMTITRLAPDRFYLNSAIVGEQHDLDWLRFNVDESEDISIADVTDTMGILAVTGPRSRDVLQPLTDTDLSNESFRWLTGQEIDVAGVPCVALRVSYVGELGWELHHHLDRMVELYEAIQGAGVQHGIVDFGSRAMNVMRMEKAYKAWGGELTTEITPVEADIERFVDYNKEFMGKTATVARRDGGELSMICVYGELDDNGADCLGNEPVYGDGELVGLTTGGAFGHSVGKSLFFAYVHPHYRTPGSTIEIDVMGERRQAIVLPEPAWDPSNERLRA